MIKEIKQSNGQSFVEFILLLAILAGIGVFFLKSVNGGISTRWRSLIIMIASPSTEKLDSSIQYNP